VLESALCSVVGAEHVLTDPDLRASAEVGLDGAVAGDRAGGGAAGHAGSRWRRCSRPARRRGCRSCRRAANTGLVGGGVPAGVDGAVVLSTRRLSGWRR
jgi:hypothetical protein